MRLLFIRHGDPDYEHDTLTEKGRHEAALLAESAPHLCVGDCFVSPLGRARATADYSLRRLNLSARTLDWLAEFPAQVDLNQSEALQAAFPDTRMENGRYLPRIAWDMVPSYWMAHPEYLDRSLWRTSEVARCSDMIQVYDRVVSGFDGLLEDYGYVRSGYHYLARRPSEQTLTFFCHFGITCVLLSHLWNVSPFILWHCLALAPTSVTEVVTEEREKGIASFRGLRLGDLSHLYAGNEPPSFSARFCETYDNKTQRH